MPQSRLYFINSSDEKSVLQNHNDKQRIKIMFQRMTDIFMQHVGNSQIEISALKKSLCYRILTTIDAKIKTKIVVNFIQNTIYFNIPNSFSESSS